ncbi:MAG: hypothetical protein ACHQ2F_05150 [Desulfobaccales bacterium]
MSAIQISKKALSNVNGTRDLTFWVIGTIEPWLAPPGQRHDTQERVHATVQKYKNRFKEAWEELSDK